MASDNLTVLNELEAKLRAPDMVMENGVGDLLKEYIKAGGKRNAAIEDLSDGYIGYAHMADVVCEWLDIAEVHGTAGSAGLGSSGSITRAFSGSGRGFLHGLSGAAAAGGGGAGAGAGSSSAGRPAVPDEFTLLQELAKERFEPAKFLSVFNNKGAADWLNQLIQARQGRQLIYDLSASHRNSLLLNYAIQRILKQGHEDEVASVGGSLASYFGVYHRLLAKRLEDAARATSAQQLAAIARDVAESCVANQHTYVHAQQLLTALAALPNGGVFRRLSQEVEAAAVAQHGGSKVYQLQPLFTPLTASDVECQAVRLVAEALSASAPNLPGSGLSAGGPAGAGDGGGRGGGGMPSAAFVAKQLAAAAPALASLQLLYQQEPGLAVQPLQHPQLMQLMLSGMFVAPDVGLAVARGASNDGSHGIGTRQLCMQLLALAVAGRAQQGHEPGHEDQQRRSLSPEVPAMGLAALQGTLQQALGLSKKMGSSKLTLADLDLATQVCQLPVAALGLLQHSQRVCGDEALYGEERIVLVLPNHLSVLHRAACEQPGLIPQVLAVLRRILTALGSNQQELSKAVLSFLVSLVVSGAADLALPMAEGWSATADPSLIRHFIQLVLESVEPPYSQSFARSMLAMMHRSLILRIRGSHATLLRGFAAGCAAVVFLPPLRKRDQDQLDELSSV